MYLTIKTLLFYKLFVEEQKKIHILKKGILAFTSPSCGCGALSDGHGRLHQTEPGVFRHQEEEMQEMCGDFFFLFQRILTDDDSVYTSSHRITFPQINESIRGAMTQLEASSQTSQTNWLSILKVTLQWIFSIFKRYFQKTCFKLFLLK